MKSLESLLREGLAVRAAAAVDAAHKKSGEGMSEEMADIFKAGIRLVTAASPRYTVDLAVLGEAEFERVMDQRAREYLRSVEQCKITHMDLDCLMVLIIAKKGDQTPLAKAFTEARLARLGVMRALSEAATCLSEPTQADGKDT